MCNDQIVARKPVLTTVHLHPTFRFAILVFKCTDPSFCGPDDFSGYRTTPAMSDPYKYIRNGNYAKILAQPLLKSGADPY